jgi:FtsP/CotA-like multicopper oxidase with cupredoxin domain
MASYTWVLEVNGLAGAPVTVAKGERVELVMRNTTMMSHPMHLQGPSFQVMEINGQSFPGANARPRDGDAAVEGISSRLTRA